MNETPKENLISIDLGLYPETLKTLDEMRGLVPRRTYLRDLVELHTACWKGEVADTQWKKEHIEHNKSIIEVEESQDIEEFGL